MKVAVHSYHFGRLNLLGAMYDGKQNYIYESLCANVIETNGKFKYLVTEITEITIDNQVFVYGVMVKYKNELETLQVNESNKEVYEGELPEGVVSRSKFFLHYASTTIAYRPIPSRISGKQFRTMFSRLIQAGKNNLMMSADVESVNEEITIRNAIQELVKIEKITIDLHPTNPSNRPVYANIDDRLKRLRVSRMKQTIIAEIGGLNKQAIEDDDAYSGVIMAADGYGDASVHGINESGRNVIINVDDSPVIARVTDYEKALLIIDQLYLTFKKIWQRKREK